MPAPPALSPSGIGPVEAAWGGFARPGAYLLVGPARSGRLHLAAQAVGGAVGAEGAPALLFSSREPADVVALAREAGVDLPGASARGRARLLRVPPASQLAALGEEGLARALADLAASAAGASRVVVEDFTPFVQFRSFEAFGAAFRRLVDGVAAHGATLVLGLGEPANDGSRKLLAFVEGAVTGTLHLVRAPAGPATLRLVPGTGHAGLAHEAPWSSTGEPAPSLFTEAPLFAEASLAPPPEEPVPASPEPEAPAEPYLDHSADGFAGGTDLDAGAFVVSTAPAEPFGYPATAPPDALPAPFGPASLAADPFSPEPDAVAPAAATSDEPTADPFLAPEGDGEWAMVQPVAFPPADPFVLPVGLDPLGTGFLVDSDAPGQAATADDVASAPDGPADVEASAYDAPAAPAPEPAPVEGEDPEAAFARDLAAAFATRATTPFLVVALRLPPGSPYFGTFPAVADGLLGALSGTDRALVRDDEAKLAVLLPGAPPETPQRLLGAVRAHLETVLGEDAEGALRSAGVLVLPNGEPFTTPDELVAYAMG